MKIMLVAGEASGDLHGSHLARALLDRSPEIRLIGIGGGLMQQAGVTIIYDPTAISAIGFAEVVKSAIVLKRVLAKMSAILDRQAPDAIVLIDFPEFNMRLAGLAKARGIPVVYYFSPSAWAWRRRRAKVVAAHATKVCAVMPLEAKVYEEAGAPVEYVGHPLIDVAKPSADRDALRNEFGCADASKVVALFPGSRKQEIDNHMVPMMEAVRILSSQDPRMRFLLGMAHTVSPSWMGAMPEQLPIQVIHGRSYDVLHAADAAMCKMGTVTLEAALIGCPIVGMYRTSASTAWIVRKLYKGRFIALPNIIADREIVPELLQEAVSAEALANALNEILAPKRTQLILEGYEEVKKLLGGPGAVDRTASIVLDVASARVEGKRS